MSVQKQPFVLENQFGDGYVQRAGYGINADQGSYTPRWTNAYKAEADYIIGFLKGQKGYLPFYWTPNGESTQLCFVCKNYTYAWKSGKFCDISAEFTIAPAL
jgi:phage-related protein